MTPAPDYSLTFDDVGIARGDLVLFEGVSFTLNPGDVIWLQGSNGSGKTTLLNLAAGFLKPQSGAITWALDGQNTDPSDLISYQGHVDALKPDLRVFEDLEFWQDVYNVNTDPIDILRLVQLSDKAPLFCRQLSAGQKRRLALARLLLSRKPVWILDEPTAAIDTAGREFIYKIVSAHAKNGGAVILATHRDPVRLSTATRVMSLEAA